MGIHVVIIVVELEDRLLLSWSETVNVLDVQKFQDKVCWNI